jgi:hypothetical protein
MAVFSRRRLRSMLDQFASHVSDARLLSIAKGLESKNTKTALATEAELAFLWALTRTTKATIEPRFPETTRRPDAFAEALFPSGPAVIEVRCISDDSFSGKEDMNRTADKIIHFANTVRRRSGLRLRFEFGESNNWEKGRYHRIRRVDPNFSVTPSIQRMLRAWLESENWPDPPAIRITEGLTDVVVTCHDARVHPQNRAFCRFPPVAYDLEDNPVFKALKSKASQFARIDRSILRCVILFDAGCSLLWRLRPLGGLWEVGGNAIIQHALRALSIDLVCVFSSTYDRPINVFGSYLDRQKVWRVTYFDDRGEMPAEEYKHLEIVASQLPRPALEGYQARSLHEQGVFKPGSDFGNLPTQMKWSSNGPMIIKVSAKRVHALLAGKISTHEFAKQTFGDKVNQFYFELERGNAIRSVVFEGAGLDEDDDYVVFELDFDFDNVRFDERKH